MSNNIRDHQCGAVHGLQHHRGVRREPIPFADRMNKFENYVSQFGDALEEHAAKYSLWAGGLKEKA